MFSPENLSLIKRGPAERRNFIDSAICREKLRNALTLQRYNRLLKQRNALLKDIPKNEALRPTLDLWDEQLSTLGAEIVTQRLEFTRMISEKAAVTLAILPPWPLRKKKRSKPWRARELTTSWITAISVEGRRVMEPGKPR